MNTIKQIRQFAKTNKINLHGETKKDRLEAIISEWQTPEFKIKHTKNVGVKKIPQK